MKMDVVVLTETKKKGTGSEAQGNYIHLFSGVKKKHSFFFNLFLCLSSLGQIFTA